MCLQRNSPKVKDIQFTIIEKTANIHIYSEPVFAKVSMIQWTAD